MLLVAKFGIAWSRKKRCAPVGVETGKFRDETRRP
jgi:hypothetical protein